MVVVDRHHTWPARNRIWQQDRGKARFATRAKRRAVKLMGTVLPPRGFEEWPVVARSDGGWWYVYERDSEFPIAVPWGGVNYTRFRTASDAAVAVCREALRRGFSVCREVDGRDFTQEQLIVRGGAR